MLKPPVYGHFAERKPHFPFPILYFQVVIISQTKIKKMKIETAIKKVTEFLKTNPASTKGDIGTGTKISGLELTNVIRALRKQGILIEDGEGKDVKLSVNAEQVSEPTSKESVSVQTQVEPDTEAKEKPTGKKSSSRTQKYKIHGDPTEYGKGRLILAVIRKYVEENNPTLAQLRDAINPDGLKRFGYWALEEKAREISGARDRFFFNETDHIKVKGKVIVVCNQITSDNIAPFLLMVKALYKIKEV
jgi:hypothetical protein